LEREEKEMMIALLISLIIIAGISNAIMDVIRFRYHRSIFISFKKQQWWNPTLSWKNKWKNGDPLQGEKYWGSSRWFVRFTDAWHFFQGLMFTCFFLSIIVYSTVLHPVADFFLIYLLFTGTFSLFYNIVFIKKIRL